MAMKPRPAPAVNRPPKLEREASQDRFQFKASDDVRHLIYRASLEPGRLGPLARRVWDELLDARDDTAVEFSAAAMKGSCLDMGRL